MKIFAKRKKVVKPADAAAETTPKKRFASDALVEALLKTDPSEWNAKEKRMVKRYQERKEAEPKGDTCEKENDKEKEATEEEEDNNKSDAIETAPEKDETADSDPDDAESDAEAEADSEEEDSGKATAPSAIDAQTAESGALELESVLDATLLGALNSKQRRKLSRMLAKDGTNAVKEVVQEAKEIQQKCSSKKTGTADDTTGSAPKEDGVVAESESKDYGAKANTNASTSTSTDMEQVQELLKGLNSKQKRTLSRRLERDGNSCLAEIRAEAEALLKGADDGQNKQAETEAGSKKRKRRRGAADLSGLTPEERLRREEQRKMQTEAAERRANGEEDASSSKFKHPLNSERRRANKRKPKWAPKRSLSNADKVEHNTSGFQVRKFNK